jgi:hypothetical protein
MPLIDIIIDTCVLLHAGNPNEQRQQDSKKLIDFILSSSVPLCIDEGWAVGDSNRSLIVAEYNENLKSGMLGHYFLAAIFSRGQYQERSKSTPAAISAKINQLISHKKPRDKTFLKVAYNSSSKTFASHDFEDFPDKKRNNIKTDLGVRIVTASNVSQ